MTCLSLMHRLAGCRAAESQRHTRRSKNEKLFAELCKKKFQIVKENEPMFNGWDADVIIEDIKTAVLWNGNWHYQKIAKNHSVKQVQSRDRLKIKEIEKAGYTPVVIEDRGKCNPAFVVSQFEKFFGQFQNKGNITL